MKKVYDPSKNIMTDLLAENWARPHRSLSICIDLDGTITEHDYWLAAANAWFQTNLRPEDLIRYSIPEMLGISESAYQAFYARWGEALHAGSQIRSQAADVVRRLARGHQIHYVSARGKKMQSVSQAWLAGHGLPADSLHLLGTHHKVAKAQALHCDLFIEDCYDNAEMLAAAGIRVLLIDCPYNRAVLPPGITRVKSWPEIEAHVARQSRMPQKAATDWQPAGLSC
jgi:hypothetical protein